MSKREKEIGRQIDLSYKLGRQKLIDERNDAFRDLGRKARHKYNKQQMELLRREGKLTPGKLNYLNHS